MRSHLLGVLALAGMAAAAPASAYWVPEWQPFEPVVLTGTMNGPDDGAFQSLFVTTPGLYQLSWKFDRTLGVNEGGEEEWIYVQLGLGWIIEFYEEGEWIDAYANVYEQIFEVNKSGKVRFTIPEPQIYEDWPLAEVTWEWIDSIGLYAGWTVDTPVGFRLTLSQVPEPSGWAMMILGFGLVGVAARRRRERISA